MVIYVVRHAYAYEHGDPRWPDDSRRPLSPEGAARFGEAVALLAERGFSPQAVATSPYVRCRQTAEIVAAQAGVAEVTELAALEPGSDLAALVAWTQAVSAAGAERVAWVGHSPDVSHLAAALIGDGDASLRFAKGAVAAIRMHGGVEPGRGELLWLASAKLLGV